MMHRLTAAAILAITLGVTTGLVATAQAQSTPANTVTAFEGARLIVGDGRAPIESATLVIDGTRLVQVGRSADVRVPAGAKRIDVTGKTIMPAIIDAHIHPSRTRDALTRDLRRLAYFGINAGMSLGLDVQDASFEIRADLPSGAARFATAGRGITTPEPGRDDSPYWVTTPEQARKAVQENAARKVDIIKIWVDSRNGQYQKLGPELYGAIIDEAHKNGLRVTAHIFELEDAKGLLRAGIDGFAHGVRDLDVDDEFMTLLRQRPELVFNPNLPSRGVATDLAWLKQSLPATQFEALEARNIEQPQAQARYAIQARNLAKMNAAGVRIVLGTDALLGTDIVPTSDSPAWGAHIEMEDMVAAGMTPMQTIVAATRNAAEYLKLADMGTLEAGKSADFIVLDANPLDDITNTRRISSVYLRGTALDRGRYP